MHSRMVTRMETMQEGVTVQEAATTSEESKRDDTFVTPQRSKQSLTERPSMSVDLKTIPLLKKVYTPMNAPSFRKQIHHKLSSTGR